MAVTFGEFSAWGACTAALGRNTLAWGSLVVTGGISASDRTLMSANCEKSTNLMICTKSIEALSAARATRQLPKISFTATPTGRPRGNTPPSPEVTTRSPAFTESSRRRYSSLGLGPPSPVKMARALVRLIITGVRDAMSVSNSTRLAELVTPATRPTRPRSLTTGLPTVTPRERPVSAMRALAKGPRLSATTRAATIGIGGLSFSPSRA